MRELGISAVNKIILVNFYDDPYLIQIAESLEESFDTYNFSLFQNTKKRSASILDLNKLSPSKISQLLQEENLHITTKILSNDFLNQFISTLDRVSIIKLSGREILAYYRKLLTVYEMYFSKHGIDAKNSAIIFDSTPHMPWDVILYALAKDQQIKTIIPRNINLPQTLQFSLDIEFNEIVTFQEEDNFLLTPSLFEYDSFAPNLLNLQKRIKSLQALPAWRQKSFGLFLFLKCAKMLFLNFKELTYFRLKKRQLFKIVLYLYLNIKKSHKILKKLSIKEPNLEEPYIYFALHAQPEMSTDPEIGIFTDQFLAIQKLSTLIPNGWLLYVKEHPVQFDLKYLHIKQLNFRSPDFYKLIQSIPNVRLVSESIPSEKLISKAKVVATGTGSVAWETVLKGKHFITFGNTWLSGHPLRITTNDLVMNREINLVNIDLLNINREYINKISRTLINSCNSQYTLVGNKSSQKMVLNFSNAVIASLK